MRTQENRAAEPTATVNVSNHLRFLAEEDPERLAVAVAQRDGSFVELSAGVLDRRVDALAAGLRADGWSAGDRCVVFVPPGLDFFVLVFALFRVEAVPVLIDPGLPRQWVRRSLADVGPVAFLGVHRAQIARLLLGWGRPTVRRAVTVGPRFLPGVGMTQAQLERRGAKLLGEAKFELPRSRAASEAAVLFTSGSTGPPKGALYTHGMFAAQVDMLRECFGITPGERDLATFPLFALFGPALGMAAVVPDMDASQPAAADPEKLLAALERYECTNAFMSPALVEKLGRYCTLNRRQLPSLERVISAGAPARAESVERLAACLRSEVEVHTPYGATECLPIATIGSSEIREGAGEQTGKGAGVCVGRPLPEVSVEIVPITDEPMHDRSDISEIKTRTLGEIGEIMVTGPNVSPRYVGSPTADAFHKVLVGGVIWHRTGDVGYFDRRGRLFMCGRKAHRVETPFSTLYSIAAEGPINTHPDVRRSALVGVLADDGSVVAGLCVELEVESRGRDQGELRAELFELCGRHAASREIERIEFHPGFPVDIRHNAKIDREALARWVAERG